jgi:hypothetical protein
MVTVLTQRGATDVAGGRADGAALWLAVADVERATGWSLGAEGFCRGDVCVPNPPNRRDEFARGGEVNAAAWWRHMGAPIVRSSDGDVWMLGENAESRGRRLHSLEAPDFTLPDLAGKLHSLSEMRGKKVLLVTWASW